MKAGCPLCGGACVGAALGPLLDPRVAWLWEQIAAAADRRGDADMAQGTLTIEAATSPEERAASGSLLGERALKAGQRRRLDLSHLTRRLRVRGPHLTPGAVAAHALNRQLAARARAAAQRENAEAELRNLFMQIAQAVPGALPAASDPALVWQALRRGGWLARVLAAAAPSYVVRTAYSIVARLPPPGTRADRRRLATDATGNPHALDEGTLLGSFTLAILVAAGRIQPKRRARAAWAEAGVDSDDVTGGLVAVGILPVGWTLPLGTVATLPPRVLSACKWPDPGASNQWVFVTENPSVASAAADMIFESPAIRLLCTSGTPFAREIAAIARLGTAGWRIAARADFDEAGLNHVAAILKGVADAEPWRMGADDYLASLVAETSDSVRLDVSTLPDADWDPRLSTAMKERGIAGYEEALLPLLLDDLQCGFPARRSR